MKTRSFLVLLARVVLVSSLHAADVSWQSKVDPWVLETDRSGSTEFLEVLEA
jgi:type IV secretory pathway TrbF-like protein